MEPTARARLAAVVALAFGASDLTYINLVLAPRLARVSTMRSELSSLARPRSAPAAARTGPVTPPAATENPERTRPLVLAPVHFARGSTVLEAEARPLIATAAQAMRENPGLRLLVLGYADNSGSDSVNLDLSWGRATSVVHALTEMGIEAGRVRAVGRGSRDPVAPNRSEREMAKNRRAELVWQQTAGK